MFENEERKVVVCADCGCEIDVEDAIELDGEYYCNDCVYYCERCGEYHITSKDEPTEVDGELWCEYCRDADAFYCENCNEWHNLDNVYRVNGRFGEEMWCESCVENDAFYCEHCDEYYDYNCYNSRSVYDYRGRERIWCEDCADNNAYYCESCENYYEDCDCGSYDSYDCWYCNDCYEDCHHSIIKDYHDRPMIEYIGKLKAQYKGLQHYVGLELEVDKGHEKEKCAERIADIEKNVYFNKDGSLSNGFEIITQPHTEEALYNIKWQEIFDACKEYGFSSHDAMTCGLHIHISREWLGRKKETQDLAIRKLILFYHTYWTDILKLSRRTNEQANDWAQDYCVNNRKELADGIKKGYYGRYYAINNCNRNTVEFRLGRGTLNAESFFAWIDFNLTLVKNSKKCKLNDLTNPTLWLKGLKDSTIKYMKEKGVFTNAL